MLPNACNDAHATSRIASNQAPTVKQLTSHQNPSAQRRFLPASSTHAHSAQSQFNAPAADHSVNRFEKRAPLGSSTFFANTPSGRRPQDEIEIGFDESSSSSPVLPTRLRFSRQRDAIDDASDEDDVTAASKPEKLAHDDEDDWADFLHLEKLPKAKDPELSGGEHSVHRFEPMPRKRPRISHTDPTTEDIAISSSPSPEPPYPAHVPDHEDYHVGFGVVDSLEASEAPVARADEEFPSSPTGPTSTFASSKFRKPTPSVLSTPTPSTRPAFKTPQVQSAATTEQSAISSLPDAFSPSRRRGKKDYIPGGAADIVRSWILALAADEPKAGQAYTERFKVVETTNDDPEGRCSLVTDENGRRWLLINERAKAGSNSGSDSTARKVVVGCSVGIKASSPAVNLPLDRLMEPGESGCNERKRIASDWSVGILWDVLE